MNFANTALPQLHYEPSSLLFQSCNNIGSFFQNQRVLNYQNIYQIHSQQTQSANQMQILNSMMPIYYNPQQTQEFLKVNAQNLNNKLIQKNQTKQSNYIQPIYHNLQDNSNILQNYLKEIEKENNNKSQINLQSQQQSRFQKYQISDLKIYPNILKEINNVAISLLWDKKPIECSDKHQKDINQSKQNEFSQLEVFSKNNRPCFQNFEEWTQKGIDSQKQQLDTNNAQIQLKETSNKKQTQLFGEKENQIKICNENVNLYSEAENLCYICQGKESQFTETKRFLVTLKDSQQLQNQSTDVEKYQKTNSTYKKELIMHKKCREIYSFAKEKYEKFTKNKRFCSEQAKIK